MQNLYFVSFQNVGSGNRDRGRQDEIALFSTQQIVLTRPTTEISVIHHVVY